MFMVEVEVRQMPHLTSTMNVYNYSHRPTLLLQNSLYMFLAPLTAAQNTVVQGMPPLLLPVRNVAAKHGGSVQELNRIWVGFMNSFATV